MYIFICEDSLNGILTGIYDAWSYKIAHRDNLTEEDIALTCRQPENYSLFAEYIPVTPVLEKAEKVRHTLSSQFGSEFFSVLAEAILAAELHEKRSAIDKANAVYKTVVFAFAKPTGSQVPYGAKVLDYLSNPYVNRVFELSRSIHNEAHHLLGFLRFQELENGVLLSTIHPKNDCITIIAEHFTDRLPQENFMIYDENRKTAAVHAAGKNFMLVDASEINEALLHRYSDKEETYQKLWKNFFESIAIQARINPKLQAQNIPKRFWKDALELTPHLKEGS